MSATTIKRPLTQLNHEIEELEAAVARLDRERAAIAQDASVAGRRLRYLRLARVFRRPRDLFELWPLAALVIGPSIVGTVLLVILHLLFGAFPLALLGLVVGLAAGAVIAALLLYHPADALLPGTIADAEGQASLADARLKEKIARISETNARLKALVDERRDQIASGKLQRAALLQRNWKAMRNNEWEDFVVEVLRTHGASVERTDRVGDQEANLVVDCGTHRVAVLTHAEGKVLDSSAIQQAIAARDRHRCDRCAIIINHRFTGAAQDFAQRNGCTAVGAGEFPDFVLGKIEF